MKRIVETTEANGLDGLLGEPVLLLCANNFYSGKLVGVNDSFVELADPALVYETGPWTTKGYQDAQPLHVKTFYVQRVAIEAFGRAK